ncbi:hypothetical protein ILUMI_13356 [Ignelater luminosus]|uniref:TIL domain-containing protein n=1 Tax=Ignelater luminosus TaxID=2038154 RepID=A0A8K0GC22_IGNLU|nr:hypothetical protein ILUMI_13356 [Ignelater luminosus]
MKILSIIILILLCITFEFSFVGGSCSGNDEVFYECAHSCPPSCAHIVPNCKKPCRPGCMCKPGYYYNQRKVCVSYDDCYTGSREPKIVTEYYGCPHLDDRGKRCLKACNSKNSDYMMLRITCYKQCCSEFSRSKAVVANKCNKK